VLPGRPLLLKPLIAEFVGTPHVGPFVMAQLAGAVVATLLMGYLLAGNDGGTGQSLD